MKTKYFISLIVAILLTAFAVRLAKTSSYSQHIKTVSVESSASEDVSQPEDVPKADVAVNKKSTPTSPPTQKVSSSEWHQLFTKVRPHFSQTDLGHKLAIIAALAPVQNENTKYGDTLNQALEYAQSHPTQTVAELSQSLAKLPNDFEESRRFLLQFAAKLETDEASRVKLLRQELARQRAQVSAKDATPFGASIAFESLMDVSKDRELLMNEARKMLKAYRGTPAGNTLFLRYSGRYPADAKQLRKEFSN